MQGSTTDEQRWQREAAFFNSQVYSDGPLHPATIQRYSACRKPFLSAEYPFAVMGDVSRCSILEVGCGDGRSSVLLALKHANVVGIDISQRAVEAATSKAARNGVGGQTAFICTPFELYTANRKFDWVLGFAILHHFLPVLPQVLRQFQEFGDTGTRYLFVEPIALVNWLRKLRLMLPIPVNGTPDERPLNKVDLATMRSAFPGQFEITYFGFFCRVSALILRNGNYERSATWRQAVYDFTARLDRVLLQKLGLRQLASIAVIVART
jgi:SAM-dependent methyltransferase